MYNFNMNISTELFFGEDAELKAGALMRQYGRKILLIYGSRRIFEEGLGQRLVESLEAVSYTHLKYVEENTIFCVSDCSCRTDREVMGEGCGHLKEDMCIQMGTAAEYYIRTGRARQITKDEVYEILQRAEENGLMHEIPNADGPGKTHAICNCCGCGCLSIRTATMFRCV